MLNKIDNIIFFNNCKLLNTIFFTAMLYPQVSDFNRLAQVRRGESDQLCFGSYVPWGSEERNNQSYIFIIQEN